MDAVVLLGLVALFGASLGSFSAVLWDRRRLLAEVGMRALVSPASRCSNCHTPIRPWRNVPLVSYALQRGRARCCGARIPLFLWLYEWAGAILAVAGVMTWLLR